LLETPGRVWKVLKKEEVKRRLWHMGYPQDHPKSAETEVYALTGGGAVSIRGD
jgi:hypothetical protein